MRAVKNTRPITRKCCNAPEESELGNLISLILTAENTWNALREALRQMKARRGNCNRERYPESIQLFLVSSVSSPFTSSRLAAI